MRVSEARALLDAIERQHGDVEVEVETYHDNGPLRAVYAFPLDDGGVAGFVSSVPAADCR